jgi:predicted ferric reductase
MICIWTTNRLLRYLHMAYRNLKYQDSKLLRCKAVIESVTDAVLVEVELVRPWNFEAGQFVYLRLPGVSRTAFMQAHPFFVLWWDLNRVTLLAKRRSGFTDSLKLYAEDYKRAKTVTAIIDGPYGKELDFTSFETVLLFATGVGIAGQLSYLKRLMEREGQRATSTRRISLYWEMEHYGKISRPSRNNR